MLAFLPAPLLLIINLILIPANSVIIAIPIMLLGIVRFILPFKAVIICIEKCNYYLYKAWVFNNRLIIALTNDIKWHIQGDDILNSAKSCIVVSNHLSWVDILFIGMIYHGKIPTTKFFMKHSLIYIPFVGLACYALGMPFLRRYSREQLLKNPALRTADLETTRKACKRLAMAPTALINFLEGTRYTKEKAKAAKSPYKHLMPPKAASFAMALGQIADKINYIYNTTLFYPDNTQKPFIELLKGRMKNVYVNIEIIKSSPEYCGDYLTDKEYKHRMTMEARDLWAKKDELLERWHQEVFNQKHPEKTKLEEKKEA